MSKQVEHAQLDDCYRNACWLNAASLAERIAAWRANGSPSGNGEIDRERAERRFKRWREKAPFAKEGLFAQRLAQEGLSEEDFRQLLGETGETMQKRFPENPDWLLKLQEAYSHFAEDSSEYELQHDNLIKFVFANKAQDEADPEASQQALHDEKVVGFLNLIRPLMRRGLAELREAVHTLVSKSPQVPFALDEAVTMMFARLPGKLLRMISRTLVLELNVARMQGDLAGETPEARFENFVERLHDRDIAVGILQEYPVLARQLVLVIDNWCAVSLEFLRHLCEDWHGILTTFSPQEPGGLKQLQGDLGDSHRGGRSVIIAEFETGFRLVYKPRSMAVEVHFQDLLRWVNARSDQPAFRTIDILDCGDHGWVEFVHPETCKSESEVERFYRRQGGYLALLYVLYATDFHLENVIAAGEHPVLIDLETLFLPKLNTAYLDFNQAVASVMEGSILQTLLLPQRVVESEHGDGLEMSGIGGEPGQLSPVAVPHWQGQGTDEMIYTRKRMPMGGSDNRPTLNGEDVDPIAYTDTITEAFAATYRLLMTHRSELLVEPGPIAAFSGNKVRVVLRHTRFYAILLYEGLHPDMLRDALERDCLYDHLWYNAEYRPHYSKMILAEQQDLRDGDVPIFHVKTDANHLTTSRGQEIADSCALSGMERVRQRISQMNEADLTKQVSYIRGSMTILTKVVEPAQESLFRSVDLNRPAEREALMNAARDVAARLAEQALVDGERASWFGLTVSVHDNWILQPTGVDLYDGLPGIALFYAYLGAVTGEERYTRLARAALRELEFQLRELEQHFTPIGAFGGWGGILYALTHLSVLWEDPELLHEAERIVDLISENVAKDEHYDIIAGGAGAIMALLALQRVAPDEKILAAATRCGERLLESAHSLPGGAAWPAFRDQESLLTGLSHGAAGIAWALIELAAATGDTRFHETAQSAIAYERSLFSPEMGNWPDLRKDSRGPDGEPTFMSAWCHGANGIGLARLLSLEHFDNAEVRAEIDTALQATLTTGSIGNHCLCHGDLGNLELLLQAASGLQEPHWREVAMKVGGGILDSLHERGHVCGNPQKVESPGLMTGLAGIGFCLLRLAQPERVPSVLALEAPRGIGD